MCQGTPFLCQGTPFPSGVNLYLFQVFSSLNQQKLIQPGGTDKGATSLQHRYKKQLQPGHVAGVGGSNVLQNLDTSAMERDKAAPRRAGRLLGILTWDLEKGGLCFSCLGTFDGRLRP